MAKAGDGVIIIDVIFGILLSDSIYGFDPIITDFGMSRIVIENENQTYISSLKDGPIKWMAPESLKSNIYSYKSDVWSFGW